MFMKEKWLTIEELIKELKTFDPTMRVICTREGKGHSYPVTNKSIVITDYCYFPYSGREQPKDDEKVLRLCSL